MRLRVESQGLGFESVPIPAVLQGQEFLFGIGMWLDNDLTNLAVKVHRAGALSVGFAQALISRAANSKLDVLIPKLDSTQTHSCSGYS